MSAADKPDSAPRSLDVLSSLERMCAGESSHEAMAMLRAGVSAWLRCGAELPLERCLGLPTTPGQLRRARRDAWLRKAAECMRVNSDPYAVATALAREIDIFLSRGGWAQWRDLTEAPAGATPLRRAIWEASRLNRGQGFSAKQLHRILRGGETDFCEEMSHGSADHGIQATDVREPLIGDHHDGTTTIRLHTQELLE